MLKVIVINTKKFFKFLKSFLSNLSTIIFLAPVLLFILCWILPTSSYSEYSSEKNYRVTDIGSCSQGKKSLNHCSIAIEDDQGNKEYIRYNKTVVVGQPLFKYCKEPNMKGYCRFRSDKIDLK